MFSHNIITTIIILIMSSIVIVIVVKINHTMVKWREHIFFPVNQLHLQSRMEEKK